VWSDPRVQQKKNQAAGVVKERAPEVKGRVARAVKQSANKVTPTGAHRESERVDRMPASGV
jgi:hypothetical protein